MINNLDRLGYPKWNENEKNPDQFYRDLILSPTNNLIISVMLV